MPSYLDLIAQVALDDGEYSNAAAFLAAGKLSGFEVATHPEIFQETADIVVHHSAEQGTIIRGETRQYRDVIKSYGFKWSARCGFWYVPSTRGFPLSTKNLERIARSLQAVGASARAEFVPATEEEADAAQRKFILEKAQNTRERAEKAAARSDAAYESANGILGNIPPGQPILTDHYSARRHRRDLEKVHRNMSKSVEEQEYAKSLSKKAERLEKWAAELTPEARKRQAEEEASKPKAPRTIKEAKAAYAAENPPSDEAKKVWEVAALIRKRIKRDMKVTQLRGAGEGWGKEKWQRFCLTIEGNKFGDKHWGVEIYERKATVGRSGKSHAEFSTLELSAQEIYAKIGEMLSAAFA